MSPLLLIVWLVACTRPADTGARTLEAGQCRAQADCDTGACFSQDDPWCGACQDAESECVVSGDCGEGRACEPQALSCPCDEPTSRVCVPVCSADSCGPGRACDEGTGLCAVLHCASSADCPEQHDCLAELEGSGCQRRDCAEDGDCAEEGWCVREACHSEPGFCSGGPA